MAGGEISGTCNKHRRGNKPVQTAGSVPLGIDKYKWGDNIKTDCHRNRMDIICTWSRIWVNRRHM